MKIAVVGIGGVGGYIGAKLCALQPKHKITFVARGEHAEAIRQNGLKIIEDDNTFTVHPFKVCEADEAEGIFDLVLLCVKSYDIASTLNTLDKNIDENSVIIPFSNGVNHGEEISRMLESRVLDGAVYILAHIERPGVIRKKGNVFALVFGSDTYLSETVYVNWLFEQADIRTKTPDDIKTALWKKYLFISAFATLTSYYDQSIKHVYEAHIDETKALFQEIAAVARAKGIILDGEIEKALKTASSLPEDAITSMYLDFQQHRPTELETLSGYIVHEAKKQGIKTPLMNRIYLTLKEK